MALGRGRPSLTSLIAFALLMSPLMYVLSYAPVVSISSNWPDDRIKFNSSEAEVADASRFSPYKPVDWIIDYTSLREPLFKWAGIWGVRAEFGNGVAIREISRQRDESDSR